MTANKTLTTKVLEVTVYGLNAEYEEATFEVFEFENGLIAVLGETTNDWFFENRDCIEGCGNDIVKEVKETGRTETWTAKELLSSVQGSISEFGVDAVPAKHLELWK